MAINSGYYVYGVSSLVNEDPEVYRIENPILSVIFSSFRDKISFSKGSKARILFNGIISGEIIKKYKIFIILPSTKNAVNIYTKLLTPYNKNRNSLIYETVKIIKSPEWEFTQDTLGCSESTLSGPLLYTNSISRMELVCLSKVLRQIINKYIYNSQEICLYARIIDVCEQCKRARKSSEIHELVNRISRSISYNTFGVLMIKEVIYNAPNTVVYWTDGTKTVVTATKGETFNKEIGLAMAISKKYFSISNDKPRAAFKNAVKNASDYTAATENKRKQKELKESKKLEETENGDNVDS